MPPAFRSSLLRRVLVWLLAGLLPLQALAAGVIAASGMAHTHLPAASTRLVLDDFRRAPVRRVAVEAHPTARLGHVHDSGAPERHHHAPGDPTLVADSAERMQADEADDMSLSPSLGVFVGLVSVPLRWLDAAAAIQAAALPRWRPQTHHPALPERPPRAIA